MKTLAKVQEKTQEVPLKKVDKVSVLPLALYLHGWLLVLTRPQHSLEKNRVE